MSEAPFRFSGAGRRNERGDSPLILSFSPREKRPPKDPRRKFWRPLGNRELLKIVAEQAPPSLDELARISGRRKSNLSRTLKTMENHGLLRLERGERGRIAAKLTHDSVALDLRLAT